MHALLAKVAGLLVAPSIFMFGFAGYHVPTIVELQNLADQQTQSARSFGAFNPSGGSTYKLSNSVGLSNSSVYLTSFKEPVSNIPYTMTYLGSSIEYGTIAPQSPVSEFVSFTGITQNSDGTAVLTGVLRGISRTPAGNGCTASTTLAQTHPAQTNFILSDSPCLFSEYYVLRNNATSTGVLTFTGSVPPRYDNVGAQSSGTYNATTSELASVAYVNAVAIAGVANATESVKGAVELATQVEMSSSTATGSTGAGLVLQAKYATSSPFTPGRYVPITGVSGTLSSLFISTSSVYTWSALNTYTAGIVTAGLLSTASTTINATTTLAANIANGKGVCLNGVCYTAPSTQAAAGQSLNNNGSGTLSWGSPPRYTLAGATGASLGSTVGGFATSTVQFTIPANLLTSSSTIEITGSVNCAANGSGADTCSVFIRNSNGVTLNSFNLSPLTSQSVSGTYRAIITATSTTASQQTLILANVTNTGVIPNTGIGYSQSVADSINSTGLNFSSTQTLTVVLQVITAANNAASSLGSVQYIINP